MISNIFEVCKSMISAKDVVQRYGIVINRRGKALCPFHADHHPSMTFREGRFRCWACGAHGDAIDLAAHLLDVKPILAVRQLNDVFGLGLPLDPRPPPPEGIKAAKHRGELTNTYHAYEAWRSTLIQRLSECQRIAHTALKAASALSDISGLEALAIRWCESLEYWCDQLSTGSMAEQIEIFRDRKDIDLICKKILNRTPTKLTVA